MNISRVDTGKCRGIQGNAVGMQGMQWDAGGCKGMQWECREMQGVQGGAGGCNCRVMQGAKLAAAKAD